MPGFRSNYRGTKNLCKRRRRRKMSKRSRFALLLFFTRLISVLSMFAFHASRSPFRSFLAALSSNGCRDRLQENAPREVSVLGRGNEGLTDARCREEREAFARIFCQHFCPLPRFPFRIESSVFSSFFPRFLSLVLSILIEITRDYCIEEETRYRAEKRIRIFLKIAKIIKLYR